MQEDLTYEGLSKNIPEYSQDTVVLTQKYTFNKTPSKENKFGEYIEKLHRQTATEEYKYEDADWLGWNAITEDGAYTNNMAWYSTGVIREVSYLIYTNGSTLNFEDSINQNFWGKEPSNSTYKVVYETVYKAPENFLNIKSWLENITEDVVEQH